MPSKKKKYNARFPAGRIKKIMQSDEEIGKVAQAVPVIISRTLELFVESLLTKTLKITNSRNARTLSTSHMKQCIMSEHRFDFLRELVKNIPDISVAEEAANYNEDEAHSSPEEQYPDSDTPFDLSMPSTSTRASLSTNSNGEEHNKFNSQNGSSFSRFDEQNRMHLKRPSGINSVMYTSASKSSDAPVSKLSRSESTPTTTSTTISNWTQSQNSHHHRQRLKHQSQSAPFNSNTMSISSSSTNSHQPKQPKRHHNHENTQKQPQTAIPSPIVNFDFCNKPIVKIDYSNIAMSAAISGAPLSAPANILAENTKTKSAFSFNAEPIINIDLSNIIPSIPPAATCTTSTLSQSQNDVLMTMPQSSRNAISTTNKNSCFELDEDYDNI